MDAPDSKRLVLRWDPYLEPDENDMEFRLTYEGRLLAHRDDDRLPQRAHHVHDIRQVFHGQLKRLWNKEPNLVHAQRSADTSGGHSLMVQTMNHDGFNWRPIVTESNGLICRVEILMLREGRPGKVVYDLDNRVKTIFDALRKARNPDELGARSPSGQRKPTSDEDPFYVLLEDDSLITHLAVTTDVLLEPVPNTTPDDAARLVIGVTVRPYFVRASNSSYV
jgi:hypothetical protein